MTYFTEFSFGVDFFRKQRTFVNNGTKDQKGLSFFGLDHRLACPWQIISKWA
jgi:hypothetical protein